MKHTRHTVTFDHNDPQSVLARALADMGRDYATIARRSGLRITQVASRLAKARRLEGLKPGMGYGKLWRRGETWTARQVEAEFLPQIEARVEATLPKKIGRSMPKWAGEHQQRKAA